MNDLMSGKLHIDGRCADLGRISATQRLFSRQQAFICHEDGNSTLAVAVDARIFPLVAYPAPLSLL